MAIGDIIVGVDIGTSKVTTVVGEVNNFNQIETICMSKCKCTGIKKGKIINENEVAMSIAKTINDAEEEANLRINSAYVTIPGKYVTIVQNSVMKEIKDKFDSIDSGICIIKLSNKYQMCSKSKYSKYVRNILDLHRHTPLTQAAMEVLAIIAYNQPVTKAFIEQVRGVDCSRIISNLSVKDLIEERGRLELPGKPLLYGTTLNFLKCFGISSIDELPPIDNLNKE